MFLIPFEQGPPTTIQWIRVQGTKFPRGGFVPLKHMLGTSLLGYTRCLAITDNAIGIHVASTAYIKYGYRPKNKVSAEHSFRRSADHPVLLEVGKPYNGPSDTGLPIYYTSSAIEGPYNNIRATSLAYSGYIDKADVMKWLEVNNQLSLCYPFKHTTTKTMQKLADLIRMGKLHLSPTQVKDCNPIILEEIERARNSST